MESTLTDKLSEMGFVIDLGIFSEKQSHEPGTTVIYDSRSVPWIRRAPLTDEERNDLNLNPGLLGVFVIGSGDGEGRTRRLLKSLSEAQHIPGWQFPSVKS